MSEQNAAIESPAPKLLTNTDIYTVRVGNLYFSQLKNGIPWTVGYPSYFTLEKAQEVRQQLRALGYAEQEVRVAGIEKKEGDFWIDDDGTGKFVRYTLELTTKVRRIFDDVPAWFIDKMRAISPESHWWKLTEDVKGTESDWGGDGEAAVMIFQENFESHGWRDHDGWIEESGKTVLISEPYAVDAEGLKDLFDFVNRCDLDVKFFGWSNHYPGRTLRIEIWPKGTI